MKNSQWLVLLLLACGSTGSSVLPGVDAGTGAWTQLTTGLPPNADVTALGSQSAKLYAMTNEGSANFYVSTDSGASWAHATGDLKIPGVTDPVGLTAFALNGTTVLAGAGLLFSSANDGQHWSVVNDTQGNAVIYTLVSAFGSDLFAGTIGGVLVSHDSGATWSGAQTDDGTGHDTPWVDGVPTAMTSIGGQYFVGVSLGKSSWTSHDHGDHWVAANAGLPLSAGGSGGASITAFGVHGSVLFAGTGGHGMYTSTDTGVSWREANTGFLNLSDPLAPTSAYAFAVSGNSVFVGTDSGVYVTTTDGASWSKLDRSGLPDFTAVYSMTVMGSALYIGTYTSGVWRHAL